MRFTLGSFLKLAFRNRAAAVVALLQLLTVVCSAQVSQQPGVQDEIKDNIAKIDRGQIDEAKKALPDLIAKYQNTPGILYLQGRIASDGIEAIKFYQSVVDNYHKSEWADDALYRIYQYYYAIGLYRTADLKLQQLRRDYPNSPLVSGKKPPPVPTTEEPTIEVSKRDATITDTQTTVAAAPANTTAPTPVSTTVYTLQVGAFSTVANAEKQKNFFDDQGYAAEITNKVRGGRSLYLVWVGSFRTGDEAMKFREEVRLKFKISGIVLEKY